MVHPLADAKYVSLTTFRKSGEPVATPVWIAPLEDQLVVISMADAWKVKRLARDPRATLQACDVRGRIKPGTPTYDATGRVALDQPEVDRVKAAMNRKYLMARIGNFSQAVIGLVKPLGARAGIFLDLKS